MAESLLSELCSSITTVKPSRQPPHVAARAGSWRARLGRSARRTFVGLKFLSSMFVASVSGAVALAATLPSVRVPTVQVSESVSAVLVGTALIVVGSAVRRSGLSK